MEYTARQPADGYTFVIGNLGQQLVERLPAGQNIQGGGRLIHGSAEKSHGRP